jgi:hypothetical protein
MKKKKVLQIQSVVMLVVFLINTFYPTVSFAVADGPSQPEFESYEDFNSTDMVDLATGDFTYNIPLVEVPSPEGGYQIPLTYHAGIELNEESTWVGLGWNLNPGVLTRQVSMYADDDLANDVVATYGGAGGNGYVKSFPFYTKYYDSEKGKGGTVNLLGIADYGWGSEKHWGIAAIVGMTVKDGKASFDFQDAINGDVALASLILSFSSCGLSQAGVAAAQAGLTAYSVGSAMMAKNDAAKKMAAGSNNAVHTDYYTERGLGGVWGKKVSYKTSISGNSTNSQYGSLYLGYMGQSYTACAGFQMQNYAMNNTITIVQTTLASAQDNNARVFEEGGGANIPSSDMYMSYETYPDPGSQMSLSYDNYSVKGNGVSGSISPYRLEIGTVADGGTDLSVRSHIGPKFLSDYKVPFMYLGDFSNSYVYQNVTNVGLPLPPNIYNQDDLYTILNDGNIYTCSNSPKTYVDYPAGGGFNTYSVNYSSSQRTESNRTGLTNKKLSHNKHIDWYKNSEITGGFATTDGFMDAYSGYSRIGRPTDGIGGFAVTNELGFTYHYALPVYNNYEKSYTRNLAGTTTYSTVNNRAFATMWLLTGITGPDFVDRGTSGIVDSQDWGYWMKFEYGKFASDYTWRNPYSFLSESGDFKSCKWGGKETYYLNKISSRTHTALFVKELKSDGKSFYESDGLDYWGNGYPQEPSSSLRLKDIYVLTNEDYATLLSSGGGGYALSLTNTSGQNTDVKNSDTFDNVLDAYDIVNANAGAQTFLDVNQQQKIHFNYDYKLCGSTYNSFDFVGGTIPTYDANSGFSSGTLKGKTTLRSVEFFSKNNSKLSPSYEFYYGNENSTGAGDDNPDYNPLKWDGYGKYKSGGTAMNGCHNAEKKADQWCLKDIITPLGATISVEYDRDDYNNINGKACSLSSLQTNWTAFNSNTLALNTDMIGATTSWTDIFAVSDVVKTHSIITGTVSIPTGVFNITSISGNSIVLSGNIPSFPINILPSKKYGDGIRVKSITTTDENANEYITKYFYTKNHSEIGPTSGVASFEPECERGYKDGDFYFYKRNEHPYSPVIYSNVTVLNGRYDNTFKETSKQTFHFVTPHEQMIDNPKAILVQNNNSPSSSDYWKFKTVDGTYVIGNLDTVKVYNQFNNLTSKTVFDYIQNDQGQYANYLGSYTEGLVLW